MAIREIPASVTYRVTRVSGQEVRLEPTTDAEVLPTLTLQVEGTPPAVGTMHVLSLNELAGVGADEQIVAVDAATATAAYAAAPAGRGAEVAYKGCQISCMLPTAIFTGTVTTPSGPMAWSGPLLAGPPVGPGAPWTHHQQGTIEMGTPKVRVGIK